MRRIGILGCGQLARMLALEGVRMGLEFIFIAIGDEDVSAVQSIGCGPLLRWHPGEQTEVISALKRCDVVTSERENLPAELLALAAGNGNLHPNRSALEAFSRRDSERYTLTRLGLPVSSYVIVADRNELLDKGPGVGFPLVIKTVCGGYDGRGQWRAADLAQLQALDIADVAFPLLVEQRVNFFRELSITAARSVHGEMAFYPLNENRHIHGILASTRSPAVCDANTEAQAQGWIANLMLSLDYAGVLTIEMFDSPTGLLINEIAPRVHNSAHWTLGGAMTSQFENHLRAICGLPLGAAAALGLCGMVNVLSRNPPDDRSWLRDNVRLYHYGKAERLGRKLGHVLVIEREREALETQLRELEALLAITAKVT